MATGIPGTAEIIGEAMERIRRNRPDTVEPGFVRERFSDAVEAVFDEAHAVYREYEEAGINALADNAFLSAGGSMDNTDARDAFRRSFCEAVRLERSLSQSRSSRAGKSFETIVKELLLVAGIPSEHVTRGDKRTGLNRIDLVIPDRETAVGRPDRAHFLSLKTSLKERWREVVEEQAHGQRTHLLTILQNEKLSDSTAMKIVEHGILLYVPDRVKDDRFPDESRIRRLSDLPSDVDRD